MLEMQLFFKRCDLVIALKNQCPYLGLVLNEFINSNMVGISVAGRDVLFQPCL